MDDTKTMSDSELLDLASKSAGHARRSVHWDPLDDDGDALRLAAALQITVMFQVSGVEARAYRGGCYIARESVRGGYEDADATAAAARRAIVRAAAFSRGSK